MSMTPQIVLALGAMFSPPPDGSVPPITMPLATREDYEEVRQAEQQERYMAGRDKTVEKQLREKWRQQELALAMQQIEERLAKGRRLVGLLEGLKAVDRLPIPEPERCRLREKIYKELKQLSAPK